MSLTNALLVAANESNKGITFVSADGTDEWCSYRYLYQSALYVLGNLQRNGLKPGDELVIQAENNRDFLFIFWACLLGKIIPVPLSSGTQADQKQKLIRIWPFLNSPYWACDQQQAVRIHTTAIAAGQEGAYLQISNRLLLFSTLLEQQQEGSIMNADSNDLAYIQFSSGSTGDPKGVCLTHDNLLCNIGDIASSLCLTQDDTLLSWMPLTHDMGLIGFHLTGLVKQLSTVNIATPAFIRRPLLWLEKTTQYNASVLYTPNFGFQYLLAAIDEQKKYLWNLANVRLIVNGAEPISPRLCDRFNNTMRPYGLRDCTITAAYGLAEAAVEVAVMPVGSELQCYYLKRGQLNIGDEIIITDREDNAAVGFVDVGYPVSACSVRICDDNGLLLPDQVIGHIQIKGRNVTAGYYNNPAATAAAFTDDHWCKTGDLGFLRNGRLVITGRLKNIIIINGQNYYPQDLEQVVINAGIADAGKVVACGNYDHETGKEALIIFILYRGNAEAFSSTVNAVRAAIMQLTGIYTDAVIPVKKIPKTTSGKIQHFKLLASYRESLRDELHNRSGELLKEQLMLIVGEVCGSSHKNLWESGLNSLTAMQLASRISSMTGVQLPVAILFEYPDIDSLFEYILQQPSSVHRRLPQRTADTMSVALTAAQRRIWTECQLYKESTAYNIPLVFSIKGPLDIGLLEHAMSSLVKQYEVLRTSFEVVDGQPAQRIHPYSEHLFTVNLVDGGSILDKPFSLDQPSLFRMSVVQRSPDEYMLYFVVHHIVADGWSLALLFRKLCAYYAQVPDPAAIVQFREYVAWQQELSGTSLLGEQRQYWQEELRELPPAAHLSARINSQYPAAPLQTAYFSFSFGADSRKYLTALADKHEATPFCIVMALLNVLLHRYTHLPDLTTGFDVTGRTAVEIENCIGYTLNTMCLRVQITGKERFSDVIAQVKRKIWHALSNQLLPFEEILAEQGNALFNILVLYQNFAGTDFIPYFASCDVERIPFHGNNGFVDLLMEFTEAPDNFHLGIQYNIALYEAGEMADFAAHFQKLLQDVSLNDQEISRYAIAPEPPLRLLHDGDVPVHLMFEQQVLIQPDLVAVCYDEELITYRQLNGYANAIASVLKDIVGPDDCVGFLLGRNPGMLIAMLGILKSGAAYVGIDPDLPDLRCEKMIADSRMKVLLTDDEHVNRLSGLAQRIHFVNVGDYYYELADSPVYTGTPDDLAYVIYTSGSTGQPKGVMIPHRSLAGYVQQFIAYFAVTGSDIVIQQTSIAFDTVVEEVFPALCVGGKVVIAPEGGRDIHELISLIKQHNATILSATPLLLNEVNKYAGEVTKSLRTVISGGDVLHASDIDRFFGQADVYNTYGPSETTVCAAYNHITSLSDAGVIGKPLRNRQVYILDDNRQLMPAGKTGEICIAGGLARGYLHQPELTSDKFIDDPFHPGRKIYCTGDIGYINSRGDLVFQGRNDQQVKIRGYRVELGEIEKVLNSHVCIGQVAVVWETGKAQLVAVIKLEAPITDQELRRYIMAALPPYMIPHRFQRIDHMPLTVSGKLDRQQLLSLLQQEEVEADNHQEPVNDTERWLLAMVRELLKSNLPGTTDNFFEHGCNSITANNISNHVYRKTGCRLEIRDIFLYPTVALLAAHIQDLLPVSYMPIKPVPLAADYALSPAQQMLWILNHIDKNAFNYNEGEVYELTGDIDPEVLKETLTIIIDRHEALRTVFLQQLDVPRQVVMDKSFHPLNFYYADVINRSESDAFSIVQQHLAMPFDLAQGPLYRMVLVRVADDRYLFTLVMHHIITDDWSAGLLMKEFLEIYDVVLRKAYELLPPAPVVTYKDYVSWDAMQPKDDRDYWTGIFKDGIPVIDLPYDVKPGPLSKKGGGRYSARVDQDTMLRLQRLCQDEQVSLFMVLVSALSVLLARYSGKYDMVIGTPVANRQHPDLDEVVGFFVNLLPLRITFDERENLQGIIKRVRKVCLDAYDHSNYPFDQLLKDVPYDRDLSRSPVFDVLINHQTETVYHSENIRLRKVGRPVVGSKYPLAFYIEERVTQMDIVIEYDSALFASTRICQMADHYIRILHAFTEDRTVTVGYVSYLTTPEVQQLLYTFNHSRKVLPAENILTMFTQQVVRHPEKVAVVYDGQSYTYAQIAHQSGMLARYLIRHSKVKTDDVVCLVMSRSVQTIIAILAVWKAGATYVPIDPDAPDARIRYVIKDTGSVLVLTDNNNHGRWQQDPLVTWVCVDSIVYCTSCMGCVTEDRAPGVIAYIIYTSGSTGEPKGVAVYHSAVFNVLYGLQRQLMVTGADRMLSVSMYTFDISVSEFFLPLISGAELWLAQREDVLDARLLKRYFEQVLPTLMQGTPGLWNMLIAAGWQGSSTLKAITCGEALSGQLRYDLLPRVGELWNLYGPTEATIFATGKRIMTEEEPITIGYPLLNTTVFILDSGRQLVPVGIYGELYIGGDVLAREYLNKPALTREKFSDHPLIAGARIYATGDLGRWLPDGTIEYAGRIDDQLKIRGFRIEPGEITHFLLTHDHVQAATVVIQEDAPGSSKLVACVVYKHALPVPEKEWRAYLQQYLPAYMIPAVFMTMAQLPLNNSGKIDKQRLSKSVSDFWRERRSENIHDRAADKASAMEKRLLAIWQRILERNDILLSDNFFDLGGHSLQVNQLVNSIFRDTGIEIRLTDVFASPTITELSRLLTEADEQAYEYIKL